MSNRKITAAEAKTLLKATTPGPWVTSTGSFGAIYSVGPIESGFSGNGLECDEADADLAATAPDLAYTVIEQSAQIKRLQVAVKELSRELEDYRPHEVAWVELTHDNILTMKDMDGANEY